MKEYTCRRAEKCNQTGDHQACTYSDGSRCEVNDLKEIKQKLWVKIEDGTAWPDPTAFGEIGWRMIHAPDSVTKADMMTAASVMEAYSDLILHPAFTQKIVIEKIQGIRNVVDANSAIDRKGEQTK